MRNGQGDIIGLFDGNGNIVARYSYDSWGNLLKITDGSGNDKTNDDAFVGYKNPLRYRGYYYDSETKLYYLQSRYYNPEWGRFLNADSIIGANGDLTSNNLFAYCSNNPVMLADPSGYCSRCGNLSYNAASMSPSAWERHLAMYSVGAAQPYVNMPGSRDRNSPNCYAYAIGSSVNEQPGGRSGKIPTKWNDVNDVGKSVEADLATMGKTIRVIDGPNAQIYNNEFRIALRVGTQPYASNPYTGELYYDYHFMRQTNTGQWAEKHGIAGSSILWDFGMTPDTIPWTLNGVNYYDSSIIYYAIGN